MNSLKVSALKFKSNSRSSIQLQGSKVSLAKDYGGLGKRYYNQLGQELDRILQVDTGTGITETKGSVRGRGIQLALEMKRRGVMENDIIVISSKNHADQTIVVLATLFLGAIVAPMDPEFSYKESLELLKQLKPKMCFCDTRTISQMERIFNDLNFNPDVVHFGIENGGSIPFKKLFIHKEDDYFQPVFIENPRLSVAFVLPSQGTTNAPKLICLSHQNIFVQTIIFLEIFNYPEKVISFFPLSWILQTILTCVCFESQITRILPATFTERSICKIIHDFAIGHAILGTDYAIRIIGNVALKDFNMNCLKCVMIGTVNTTKHDIQQLKTLMPNVKFLLCYCTTETGCIAASKIENYSALLEKPDSVGRLSMNSKIRIVDLETKENLGPDKYGELYYNGDGMMLGYFKDTEGTLATMESGFFKTGDMAMYDEDGWIYLKGRIEDFITNENGLFCPIDLEDIILAHPFVRDVVVIGNGKELLACVVKREDINLTAEKLLKFISERTHGKHIPTKIVFMENFPRTSIGNVKKRILREDFLEVKIGYTESLASMKKSIKSKDISL